jgi:hypothetical protein
VGTDDILDPTAGTDDISDPTVGSEICHLLCEATESERTCRHCGGNAAKIFKAELFKPEATTFPMYQAVRHHIR